METSLQPLAGEGEAEEGFGGWGSRGHIWERLQPGPAPISRGTQHHTGCRTLRWVLPVDGFCSPVPLAAGVSRL